MKVVIIGGGAAGMTAASRIKSIQPRWDVTVFEATNFVSHAPCGIPYLVEGLVPSAEDLMYYTADFFKEKRGINVKLNSKVIEADTGFVRVDENGSEKKYEWDKLIIATGSLPRLPAIDGIDCDKVFTVHHPADADKLKKHLLDAKKVVIIGAGYIGLEMSEALLTQKKQVTLIGIYDYPLPRFDEEIGNLIKDRMVKEIDLRMRENVKQIEDLKDGVRVVTDKSEYKTDIVVISIGARPNVELAKQLGCKIGETGAIWTNDRMQTNVEDVYAAGDCAETVHMITKKRVWIPLAPSGNKMGYVAGVNAAGGDLRFPGVLGTQFTKFLDMEIASTGLTEKAAKNEGYNIKSVFIHTKTRVHYYPGAGDLWLKVVAENKTNRILGAQAVGSEAALRINVFAAIIYANLTTKDAFFLDLGYAPPFSPIWDPIVVSARVLKF